MKEMAAQRHAARIEADKAQEARLSAAQRRKRKFEIVAALVANRNPTQRDADKRLFLSSLTDDLEREDFRTRGWTSALNSRAIFAFWEDMSPGAFSEVEEGIPNDS